MSTAAPCSFLIVSGLQDIATHANPVKSMSACFIYLFGALYDFRWISRFIQNTCSFDSKIRQNVLFEKRKTNQKRFWTTETQSSLISDSQSPFIPSAELSSLRQLRFRKYRHIASNNHSYGAKFENPTATNSPRLRKIREQRANEFRSEEQTV